MASWFGVVVGVDADVVERVAERAADLLAGARRRASGRRRGSARSPPRRRGARGRRAGSPRPAARAPRRPGCRREASRSSSGRSTGRRGSGRRAESGTLRRPGSCSSGANGIGGMRPHRTVTVGSRRRWTRSPGARIGEGTRGPGGGSRRSRFRRLGGVPPSRALARDRGGDRPRLGRAAALPPHARGRRRRSRR